MFHNAVCACLRCHCVGAVQSQKAVTAYFTSNQVLPFGSAEQHGCGTCAHCTCIFCQGRRLLSQQTRDTDPMLFWCWADVEDGGPTSKQHWVSASCLLDKPYGVLALHNAIWPCCFVSGKTDRQMDG